MKTLPDKMGKNWRLSFETLPSLDSDITPQKLKSFLSHARTQIVDAFKNHVDITHLIHAQARVVDQVLYHLWLNIIGNQRVNWSLVAVGGYGRAELHPGSDIDLMILIDQPATDSDSELISQYITQIWDSGLELGHSVRTLDDCTQQATSDITVVTNLMESRLIAGSPLLYDEMRHRTGPDKIWSGETFYEAKIQEQKLRHKRYFSSSYSLEPNIKESPGGLRDIQVIGWVTKRHFKVDSLNSLASFGFLTPGEIKSLQSCLNFLWRIRFALHLITSRREDRLLFDHQGLVAELLGFGNHSDQNAVENLMKDYYRTVLRIRELNDMLLQLFNEVILQSRKDEKIIPLNEDFQISGKLIEVRHENVFQNDPSNILRLFVHLADHSELRGIRAQSIRLLQQAIPLITSDFRNQAVNKQLFISLLSQHGGINHAFVYMKRFGVLKHYLPVYAQIVGQMQFDLFHIYTVDEHTLFLLKNIARFAIEEHFNEFPICSDIVEQLKRPELLYIAALFHDIAKGRGGDHSQLGAAEAKKFCLQHELRIEDAELVSWLVQNHLLMSQVAQRQDISDPEIIAQFASKIQERRKLKLLYVLTVADIRATNPALWNGWKDALLKDLYLRTLNWLKSPEMRLLNRSEFARQNKSQAMELLQGRDIPVDILHQIDSETDDSYFQKYSSNQVAWHCENLWSHQVESSTNDQNLVVLRRHPNDGASEIFIYCPDRKGLFSDLCLALYELQLSIVNATIHTLQNGFCMDTFIILEMDGTPINSSRRNQLIASSLKQKLKTVDSRKREFKPSQKYRIFDVKTSCKFTRKEKTELFELMIITLDRPGLLAQIGAIFNELNIRLHGAKIATFGEKTEDIFLVSLPKDSKYYVEDDYSDLEKQLINQLDR